MRNPPGATLHLSSVSGARAKVKCLVTNPSLHQTLTGDALLSTCDVPDTGPSHLHTFSNSGLKAPCEVCVNTPCDRRGSEKLRDLSKATQLYGDTNVILPTHLLNAATWPGSRRIWTRTMGRPPLSFEGRGRRVL